MFRIVLLLLSSWFYQPAPVRVFEDTAGAISEISVNLAANQRVQFETVALSPGADPVLHLWDVAGNRELAFDDNGAGGKAARVTFQAPANMIVTLIVRPRAVWSKGSADITMDGQPWQQGVRFDGWLHPLLNLTPREEIHVVSSPTGPPAHRFYVLSDDGLHIEHRQAPGSRTKWTVPAGFSTFRTFLIGTSPVHAHRRIRLLRNDGALAGRDPDGDGLGSQLEAQLKTCSTRQESFDAFECSSAADLRDTDGDGISDGWEVLGRDWRDPQTKRSVYVALPFFGADPRHKDLFVEVDYRRLTKRENELDERHKMPALVAREVAAAYGDAETTHPLVAAFHGRLLGNPTLQKGIRVHLDTGVEPESEADAGIYGNWGGYDAIDAIQLSGGRWEGRPPGALWRTHMHPSRYGIFKYGPGHISGGGQCGTGVACGYNMRSSSNAVHELGHSFALNHTKPTDMPGFGVNCSPNYRSAMSYAYIGKRVFSDGQNRPPLNNTALKEWNAIPASNTSYLDDLVSVFGYAVDPVQGHVDWNRDGAVAPAGETVRAYANHGPNMECELTRMNKSTIGGAKTNTSLALARAASRTYMVFVDTAGTVRYASSASSWTCTAAENGCPGSSWGGVQQGGFTVKASGVDAASATFAGRTYLAIVMTGTDGTLWHRFAVHDGGNVTWTPARLIPSTAVAGEPSLAGIRDGTGLFLAYKGTDNVVRWRTYDGQDWTAETVATQHVLKPMPMDRPIAISPDASPAIVNGFLPFKVPEQPMIYGAFTGTTGAVSLYWLDLSGRWVNTGLMMDSGGKAVGRPALAWVPASPAADFPGTFYVGSRRGDGSGYWMHRSFNGKIGGKTFVGLGSYFDNSWLEGAAIDFVDSNAGGVSQLWAAIEFNGAIEFRPRADGIVDLPYRNYDDWTVLGWGICRFMVNPLGNESNPVACKARPY